MITGYDFIMERLYSGDYYDYDTDFFGQKLFANYKDSIFWELSQLEDLNAQGKLKGEKLNRYNKLNSQLRRTEGMATGADNARKNAADAANAAKELNNSNKRNQYLIDKYHGGSTQAYLDSEVKKAVDAANNQSQGEIAKLKNQLNEANSQLGAANKRIAGFEKGASEKAKEVGQSVAKAAEEAVAKEAAEEAAPWYKKAMKNKWVKYGVPVAAVGGLGAYAYGRSRNRREREYYG